MSTDRKRLTSAIQRIAREDPQIRDLLKDFRNSGGKPSESATSGSGAEDRQICCDGSTSGSANPSVDIRDTSEGGQDASDGLGGDPADLGDMGGGSLVGVKDCATGAPVCFEGSDWIPPDGWEDPVDPPPEDGYEEGFYWSASGECKSGSPCGVARCVWDSVDNRTLKSCAVTSISGNEATVVNTVCFTDDPDNCTTVGATYQKFDCLGSEDAWCTDVPYMDEWPEDGCINLATKGGKLVASKYDPEAQGTSYLKGVGSIELCDDFGNSFELSPSASGGWKSISSQNPDDGYLYNAQGEQIARISGSEYSDPNV